MEVKQFILSIGVEDETPDIEEVLINEVERILEEELTQGSMLPVTHVRCTEY